MSRRRLPSSEAFWIVFNEPYINSYMLQKRLGGMKWGYTLSRLERAGWIRRVGRGTVAYAAEFDSRAALALVKHPNATSFYIPCYCSCGNEASIEDALLCRACFVDAVARGCVPGYVR